MKRFGAMLLTMAMLLSLAVTGVSAEDADTSSQGKTVSIMFNGLGKDNSSKDALKAYKVIGYDDGYNDFVDAKGVAEGKKSFWEYLEAKKSGSEDAIAYLKVQDTPDKLRDLLKGFMGDTDYALPTVVAFTATNTDATVNVAPGYYILQVESPSKIYNTMLLFVGYDNGKLVATIDASSLTEENGVYTATMKSQVGPTVEKKVFDDRNGAEANNLENKDNWKTTAASEVGKIVKFAVKVTLPTYPNDANVTLVLKDTLKNMEYVENSVKVYKNDDAHTVVADAVTAKAQKYPNGEQSLDFTLDYNVLKNTTAAPAEFYVYYEATLRENAVVGDDGNNHQSGTNTALMNYTVKTSAGNYNGASAESTVTVYTYNFKLDKTYGVGNNGVHETDAEFSVYTDEKLTTVMKFAAVNSTDGDNGKVLYYYPSTTGEVTSIPANFEIRGLDVNTKYYVKEVKTAPGYYLPTSYFTLELSGAEDEAKLLTGDLTYIDDSDFDKPSTFKTGETVDQQLVTNGRGSNDTGHYGEINTNADKKYEYDVTLNNSTTPVLPSTGGMGTTLFTVGGVALLALAAAMLILRRRKN